MFILRYRKNAMTLVEDGKAELIQDHHNGTTVMGFYSVGERLGSARNIARARGN